MNPYLSDPRFAGHATMMDDAREVFGSALLSLGHDMNSLDDGDLKEAFNLVNGKWKPNLAKFDAEAFGKSFASGDLWLCQGYPEIVYGEVDESRWDEIIDFFIPEVGGPATLDCMVILKDAPHPELANEFINFIHNPENYALFIDEFRYPCVVNPAALQYVTTKPMYDPEQALNCTLKADLGDGLDKYHELKSFYHKNKKIETRTWQAGPSDGKKVLAPPAIRSRLDACGQAVRWRVPPNFSCLRPAFNVRVSINSIFHKTEPSFLDAGLYLALAFGKGGFAAFYFYQQNFFYLVSVGGSRKCDKIHRFSDKARVGGIAGKARQKGRHLLSGQAAQNRAGFFYSVLSSLAQAPRKA